jgi:hypothetical protein
MTRKYLIQRCLEQVYGGKPTADRAISDNLVNSYINDGIAIAAKAHWKENIQIEGIGFLNNSFYTTFKGLALTEDSGGTGYWKCTLPQIPYGLGRTEGIKSVKIKDGASPLSKTAILLNADQWEYSDSLPRPNGIFAKNEGTTLYFKTEGVNILFYQNTATVTMASGGDSTDLTSTLNVPDEWIGTIQQYVIGQLMAEKNQRKDTSNDGEDNF